jgi:hypothetical protein
MEKSATPDFQDTYNSGHAIAHEVSHLHQLSIMAAQARSQVKSCGICGGQSGTEAGFLQILWFALLDSSPSYQWQHYPSSSLMQMPLQQRLIAFVMSQYMYPKSSP